MLLVGHGAGTVRDLVWEDGLTFPWPSLLFFLEHRRCGRAGMAHSPFRTGAGVGQGRESSLDRVWEDS